MKTLSRVVLAIGFLFSAVLLTAQGRDGYFSPDQLDNLLAPIALYPDPLLAQVLTASTYVDQVESASRLLRPNDRRWIDAQPWDVSVKSVAHYPSVLRMMSNKPDWTTAVGQAYVNQSTDVVTSIQRLRQMARTQGNLVSNQQQEVLMEGEYIAIDPIQAEYLYVPDYDPAYIYYRHGNFLSFGAGFAIGVWLNYDFNWGRHGVFYHGWGSGERGWIGRSRGYAGASSIYINSSYRDVHVNREVVRNTVNYNNLSSYNGVHNTTNYNNVAASHAGNTANRGAPATNRLGNPAPAARQQPARVASAPSNPARSTEKPSAMDQRTPAERNRANTQVATRPAARPQPAQAPGQPQGREKPQQAQRQEPQQRGQPQQAQRQPEQGRERPQQPQRQPPAEHAQPPKQAQTPKQPPPQHAQAKPPARPEHPEKP